MIILTRPTYVATTIITTVIIITTATIISLDVGDRVGPQRQLPQGAEAAARPHGAADRGAAL